MKLLRDTVCEHDALVRSVGVFVLVLLALSVMASLSGLLTPAARTVNRLNIAILTLTFTGTVLALRWCRRETGD